jgi:adenine C2-methylase RlmN of 23S rRNA A2503 and tRNA A37
LIPGRRKIDEIMKAVDQYAEAAFHPRSNPFPVRINVVLMESPGLGLSNATLDDAHRLVEFMQSPGSDPVQVSKRLLKLSAFNPIPGRDFRAPSPETCKRFVQSVIDAGISLYTFQGSGISIDEDSGTGGFACGQLRATTAKVLQLHGPTE